VADVNACPKWERLMLPTIGTMGYDADGTEYRDVKSCLVCKAPVYGVGPDGLVPLVRLSLQN
jgi:hypothetical protein